MDKVKGVKERRNGLEQSISFKAMKGPESLMCIQMFSFEEAAASGAASIPPRSQISE